MATKRMMSPGEFKEHMTGIHARQRSIIVIMAIGAVIAIVVLGYSLFRWSTSSSAQEVATPTAEMVTDQRSEDLEGRIEELSRSQDRLVQAVIGIITVTGTGFFVLVGYSAFQANRNAERESNFIRESAQIQITTAVSTAKNDVEDVVSTAKSDLEAKVETLEKKFESTFAKRVESEIRGMERLASEKENDLIRNYSEANQTFGEALTAFQEYFLWTSKRQIDVLAKAVESNDVHESRRLGKATVELGLVAYRISREQGSRTFASLERTSLALIYRGVIGLRQGYTIPEENQIWYEHDNYGRVKRVLDELARNEAHRGAVAEIREEMPVSASPLDQKTLQRMIDQAAENAGG